MSCVEIEPFSLKMLGIFVARYGILSRYESRTYGLKLRVNNFHKRME